MAYIQGYLMTSFEISYLALMLGTVLISGISLYVSITSTKKSDRALKAVDELSNAQRQIASIESKREDREELERRKAKFKIEHSKEPPTERGTVRCILTLTNIGQATASSVTYEVKGIKQSKGNSNAWFDNPLKDTIKSVAPNASYPIRLGDLGKEVERDRQLYVSVSWDDGSKNRDSCESTISFTG
jgi:hypothetical protein